MLSSLAHPLCKVQTFWEAHKNLCNLPHALYIYLVNVQTMRKIFSDFVCFSESPNFTYIVSTSESESWKLTLCSSSKAMHILLWRADLSNPIRYHKTIQLMRAFVNDIPQVISWLCHRLIRVIKVKNSDASCKTKIIWF